jgi:hypothetical protein
VLWERCGPIDDRLRLPEPPGEALVEEHQKDYAGAETYFQGVLQIDRPVSGERHADVASALHSLAWLLHPYRGLYAAAPLYRESLRVQTEALAKARTPVKTRAAGH